jgi:hypothetical protein
VAAHRALAAVISTMISMMTSRFDLGSIDIQPMQACKCQFSVLRVLTYIKYAALRVTKNHYFRRSLS